MIIQARLSRKILPLTITHLSKNRIKVTFPYDPELVAEVKSWEGAKWHPEERVWHADWSERNRYCIDALSGKFDPRYFSVIVDFIDLTYERKLYQHQVDMVKAALARRRIIWACEPGTGKTLAAIEVMERIPGYYWIIVPRTARAVWEYELEKWSFFGKIYDGSHRLGTYSLINMHLLVSLLDSFKGDFTKIPDHLIIDEVHFFKNPDTQRSQSLLSLAELVRKVNSNAIILPMTGTPSPKDPTDWWMLAELCQPGFLRESTKKKLKWRLGIFEDMGDFKKLVKWRKPEVDKLYRRLSPIVVIKMAKDCLDLPDIIYKEQRFSVSPEIKQIAKFLKDTSPRAITALIRLRQLSDGFQPTKECGGCGGNGRFLKPTGPEASCPVCGGSGLLGGDLIDTPKDEALLEYLQEDRDRIVIYAGFHHSIDKIIAMAIKCDWFVLQVDGRGTFLHTPGGTVNPVTNSQEIFAEKWGKVAYIGHPTAGGVSITLNKSEIIIFYSNDFNGASRMQAIKRIHRIGTTKAVIVDFLWLPSDKLVLDNLKLKKELQDVTMGQLNEFWEKY